MLRLAEVLVIAAFLCRAELQTWLKAGLFFIFVSVSFLPSERPARGEDSYGWTDEV